MKKMFYLVLSVLCVGAQDAAAGDRAASRWDDSAFDEHIDDMNARLEAAHGVSAIRNPQRVSRAELHGSGGAVGGNPIELADELRKLRKDNKTLRSSNALARQDNRRLLDANQPLKDENERFKGENQRLLNELREEKERLQAANKRLDAAPKIKRQTSAIAALLGITGAYMGRDIGSCAAKAVPAWNGHEIKLGLAGLVVGGAAGVYASKKLCAEKIVDKNSAGIDSDSDSESDSESDSDFVPAPDKKKLSAKNVVRASAIAAALGFAGYGIAKYYNYNKGKKSDNYPS